MTTAIDSNILLDILLPNSPHGDETELLLVRATRQGAVIISETVYSEVAPRFDEPEGLDGFLANTGVRLERSSREALHRAGQAWRAYSRQRPRLPACSACGTSQEVRCKNCGADLQFRQHTIGDFLIGGHAVVHADRLLTRDRRSYPRYFPELALA